MAEFTLSLAEIEAQGSKQYAFEVPKEWLCKALEDTEFEAGDQKGSLEVSAQQTGDDLLVQGTLATSIVVPCSRCNEPVPWPVQVRLTHVLSPLPETRRKMPEDLELTPEDLDKDHFSGDFVELDALVREHILLSVPMQPKHTEGCDPEVMRLLEPKPSPKAASPFAALLDLRDDALDKEPGES